MAVLPLSQNPDTVLRQKAKKVTRIDDASIQKLIDDMIETMHASSGVGLAAPQVGVSLRVVVIGIPGEEIVTLINPEIVKRGGERQLTEGCLSVPGYQGEIYRSMWVKVKGKDRYGKYVRIKGEGLLGQALEHEIDHLNGVLYIDHVNDRGTLYKVESHSIEEDL